MSPPEIQDAELSLDYYNLGKKTSCVFRHSRMLLAGIQFFIHVIPAINARK
jgi:hypothetical protein